MAASYGTPTPGKQAPGPTPDQLVSKENLATVVFDTTAEGMEVMKITFPRLSAQVNVRNILQQRSQEPQDFQLRSARDEALAEGIYNRLIGTTSKHNRIMLNMATQCGRNGPCHLDRPQLLDRLPLCGGHLRSGDPRVPGHDPQ
eukprot:3015988-Prymnesium_polylepis.1